MNRGIGYRAAMWHWTRTRLFSSWPSSIVSLVIIYLAVKLLPALIDWALIRAVWSPHNAAACRDAASGGACWAFVAEKHRFFLFGTYPADEHWRPALVIASLLALYAVSAFRLVRRLNLFLLWLAGASIHRPTHVGRCFRPDLRRKRALGRTDSHSPAQHLRHRLGVSPVDSLGPRAALGNAVGPLVFHWLYRIDSRRAADLGAVHGLGHAAVVLACRVCPSTSSCAPSWR